MRVAVGKSHHSRGICRHGIVVWISPSTNTPPTNNGAIGLNSKRCVAAGGDRDDAAQTNRHRALTLPVITPGHDSAVRFQGEGVGEAGRDRDDAAETGGHGCLALVIVAPSHDGAV